MAKRNDEIERWFLLRPGFSPKTIPVPYYQILIHQYYLNKEKDGETRRIRKSRRKGRRKIVYNFTSKRPTEHPSKKSEYDPEISKEKFEKFLRDRDPKKDRIIKWRNCFTWKGQFFELDLFAGPKRLRGLLKLEIELKRINQKVRLPPFLPVLREVTGQKRWSSANLATKSSRINLAAK